MGCSGIKLYARYMGISVRSQMEYRGSFIMQSIGHFLITCIEFLTIGMLFNRFGGIRGWTLPEVGLFYGMTNTAFALGDAAARGFDVFGALVKSGDFDRILLRPRNAALQVAGQELTLRRVGRLLQGLAVLVWSSAMLSLSWTFGKVLLLTGAILCGMCLFFAVIVLQATAAFWTVETLEMFNTLSYGGVQTSQYPLTIYNRWFQRFFTFVVPLAAVTYFPAIAILGREDPLGTSGVFQHIIPFIGVAFLAVSLQVWKIGVRHYRSTGS
jgi:ABC-2 type transport system permease protein